MAGFGAVIFQFLLNAIWDISYTSFSLPWYLVLLIPAIGGLLAGIIIMRWAPETAGSGTDHIIDAIHHHGGKVRARIVPVKIAASALTIGSGGSSGNEGPISQISGGIASFVGSKLHFSRSDMRILVITGMAAGWSAVFRAPLGSAIFAIEVPYKNDMESSAAIPSIISSVTSYLVFIPFGGAGPLFSSSLPNVTITADLLVIVLILGAVIGIVGIAFVLLMRRTTSLFRKSSIPLPAATFSGGLLVGIIGLEYPQVLGLGDGTIQLILDGTLITVGLLVGLLIAKMVATSLTVGSGGSGGIFFPSLIIGGAVGGTMAMALNLQPYPLFVLVGMGAMMAGVSKTPIAAAVLITEMVGGFIILVPLMVASTVSYVVTGKYTLYESQVTSSRIGVDFSTLGEIEVKDMMSKDPVFVDLKTTPRELSELIKIHPHHLIPVVHEGRVIGIITRESIQQRQDPDFTVSDIIQTKFHSIKETSSAADAFEIMASEKISTIVVVKSDEDNGLVGVVTRIDIFNAMEHMDEKHHAF
jgi:CIC family chloride channel protein